jgi:FkbM family methyltransferase
LNLSKSFRDANIHSFEPLPWTFAMFERNRKLNSVSSPVANNFGLSNEEKDIKFFFNKSSSGSSSMKNITQNIQSEQITCKVTTLDKYVRNSNLMVDFIKCDVEGAELFVFQGGLETLKAQKPIIFTEMLRKWSANFNYHPNDIIKLLKNIGYFCYEINSGRVKLIDVVTEATEATNFIFVQSSQMSIIEKFA